MPFLNLLDNIWVSDYILADFENAKKGFDKVMGGKVLELKTDKLIREIKVGVQKDMIIYHINIRHF